MDAKTKNTFSRSITTNIMSLSHNKANKRTGDLKKNIVNQSAKQWTKISHLFCA